MCDGESTSEDLRLQEVAAEHELDQMERFGVYTFERKDDLKYVKHEKLSARWVKQ